MEERTRAAFFQDGTSASTECGFFVDPTIPQEYNLLRGLSNWCCSELSLLAVSLLQYDCAPGLQTFGLQAVPMKGSVARIKSVNRSPSPVRQVELYPIVGIGASAGGLEAFTELLRGLPQKTGMGFVLVQHLDPSHSSDLREILAGITKDSGAAGNRWRRRPARQHLCDPA